MMRLLLFLGKDHSLCLSLWSFHYAAIRLNKASTQSSRDRDVSGYGLGHNWRCSGNAALNTHPSEVVTGRLDRILVASPLHLLLHGPMRAAMRCKDCGTCLLIHICNHTSHLR